MAAALNESGYPDSVVIRLAVVLLCTLIIVATFGFGLYLFSALANDMRLELGFSYSSIGVMTGMAQLGFLAGAVLSSVAVPRLGEAAVVVGAGAVTSASLILMSQAEQIWLVGLLLVVLAMMAALAWTPMVALIGQYIPPEHQAKSMGLIGSGTSYGIFINGLLLPLLLDDYGWRTVWLAVGAGSLLVVILAGLVLVTGGHCRNEQAMPSLREQWPALMAVRPWSLLLAVFFAGIGFIAFMNFIPVYTLDQRQLGVDVAGVLLMIIGSVGMFAGILCGALGDRVGIKPVILSMALALFAAAVMVAVELPVTALYVAAGMFGCAYVGYFALVPAYIGKHYPATLVTSLFAGANLAMAIGATFGNFLGGWSRDLSGSFVMLFVGVAVTALCVLLLSLRLREG